MTPQPCLMKMECLWAQIVLYKHQPNSHQRRGIGVLVWHASWLTCPRWCPIWWLSWDERTASILMTWNQNMFHQISGERYMGTHPPCRHWIPMRKVTVSYQVPVPQSLMDNIPYCSQIARPTLMKPGWSERMCCQRLHLLLWGSLTHARVTLRILSRYV